MKCVIVYLIRGEVQAYQQDLINKLAEISGEEYVAKTNPIPQHITLKAPFDTEDLEKLERVVEEFAKTQKQGEIKIRGFNNFDRFVAFLDTKFDDKSKAIQKGAITILAERMNLKLHEHDKSFKPHATVAYGNTKETFDTIWNYLEGLEKPKFDLKFDNITIMIKPEGSWKVHKVYEIE